MVSNTYQGSNPGRPTIGIIDSLLDGSNVLLIKLNLAPSNPKSGTKVNSFESINVWKPLTGDTPLICELRL